VTIGDRPGSPVHPITTELLFQAWASEHTARRSLSDRKPVVAARLAYRMMLKATHALVWERHRLRFRVRATVHAAFWERFARPGVGLVDAELHRWLLEAYAWCGRDGTVPAPRVTPEDAARTLERARAFLAAAHRLLGLRPPVAPGEAGDERGR
jgi:hypothetical protein